MNKRKDIMAIDADLIPASSLRREEMGSNKVRIRLQAFRFLRGFGNKIAAKFNNICSKTGAYDVPPELFQKRTSRKNRALISWQAVKNSGLTMAQLNSFEGGVVVEFKNNDYFDESNQGDQLFKELCGKIGCDENVSAIISIRSEAGSSSSAVQRKAFSKLINNTEVQYRGSKVVINSSNYQDYAIKQNIRGQGQGNETWSGFLFVSIRGGQQDTIQTHAGQELTLFNPACEYASADVCEDINLVMAYYALVSIGPDTPREAERCRIMKNIEIILSTIKYDNDTYKGNLLDYVKRQYSVSMIPDQLTDPIQIAPIYIENFNIAERAPGSIDVTHEEAVIFEKYYWDNEKHCVLSPARPTNLFWSYHLSNMMQQNYSLDDYFNYEKERFEKRQALINSAKNN